MIIVDDILDVLLKDEQLHYAEEHN